MSDTTTPTAPAGLSPEQAGASEKEISAGSTNTDPALTDKSGNKQETDPAKPSPNLKKFKTRGPWGEEEVEIDLNNEEALLKMLQKGKNADFKTSQLSQLQKSLKEKMDAFEQAVKGAKGNKKALFEQAGLNEEAVS